MPRSLFEREVSKIIDWLMRRLTPNTIYYNPDRCVFKHLDALKETKAGDQAAIYLAGLCVEWNCSPVMINITGLTVRGEEYGDWQLAVWRIDS